MVLCIYLNKIQNNTVRLALIIKNQLVRRIEKPNDHFNCL